MKALLLAALAAGPAPWAPRAHAASGGGSVKLIAYDRRGRPMNLAQLLAFIGRADKKPPLDPRDSGLAVSSPEGSGLAKPRLRQSGGLVVLEWDRLPRIQLSLPWPVAADGFSTVWADKNGEGFADGDAVFLNEEIALTQYRLFEEDLQRRSGQGSPPYQAGPQGRKLTEKARQSLSEARESRSAAKRAAAFDAALQAVSLAWERALFEHGRELARGPGEPPPRFGLSLDESLLERPRELEWLAAAVRDSGANWARLVFRSNPRDFAYSEAGSFKEYDAAVSQLRKAGLRIMGCVLDAPQRPGGLTPAAYAARTKNLILHYKGLIASWEIASDLNGDWPGGLSPGKAFAIYAAAAAQAKKTDPSVETVASLRWWDGTAPDAEHALFGWLSRRVPQGFGRDLDVVAVSLDPEDDPVGLAFATIFERVHRALPGKRLMLGSIGYVEKKDLKGYWWLDPFETGKAREDLATLYTAAACAVPRSLCGGFWRRTLEDMLPAKGKKTGLYKAYQSALRGLVRPSSI